MYELFRRTKVNKQLNTTTIITSKFRHINKHQTTLTFKKSNK